MSTRKSFPVDRQFEKLLYEVGHETNLKGIAARLRVPLSTINELLNLNNAKRFPAASLPVFIEAADDDRIIDYLCAFRDRVAVPIQGPGEGVSREEWLEHLAIIIRETGEASSTLADSLADGTLEDHEIEKCLKETAEAIQALVALSEALKAESGD